MSQEENSFFSEKEMTPPLNENTLHMFIILQLAKVKKKKEKKKRKTTIPQTMQPRLRFSFMKHASLPGSRAGRRHNHTGWTLLYFLPLTQFSVYAHVTIAPYGSNT